MTWWIASLVSLFLTEIILLLGLFNRNYKDNLLQCAGMITLVWACATRLWDVWQYEIVDPRSSWFHIGIALFALGTVVKVAFTQGREHRWKMVVSIDSAFQRMRDSRIGALDSKPHHHHG